ncbi:MAG: glycosyltransferase family 4 protein [Acidimicrobiales bacterium]
MRTLVAAGEYPWPENSGSRLRLATVLRGLTQCGPTDLFSILPAKRQDIDVPDPAIGLDRVGHVSFDDRPPSGLGRLAAAVDRSTPFELPRPDGGAALQALTRFCRGRYDLVWYFGIRPLVLTGGMVASPAVLDLVDLEDQKIAARRAVPGPHPAGLTSSARRLASRLVSADEVRRWRHLQRDAGTRVAVTVVCSDLDAERARAGGVPRVAVVPNGYRLVPEPVGRVPVADPPTVVFQGTLRYPPNADGARFLVDEVGPMLRRLVPAVRIRLVGATTPALLRLDDPPAVTLVGQVPDIADELARADVVVVPLRFGSGTRLKVLEAFAQRVPVVSTMLGAEGLGAVDGVHLLLADTPDDIAAACSRLLGDDALRAKLAEGAHELFRRRFADDVVADAVADLALRVAGGESPGGR